jgi:hypothetical protein
MQGDPSIGRMKGRFRGRRPSKQPFDRPLQSKGCGHAWQRRLGRAGGRGQPRGWPGFSGERTQASRGMRCILRTLAIARHDGRDAVEELPSCIDVIAGTPSHDDRQANEGLQACRARTAGLALHDGSAAFARPRLSCRLCRRFEDEERRRTSAATARSISRNGAAPDDGVEDGAQVQRGLMGGGRGLRWNGWSGAGESRLLSMRGTSRIGIRNV